MKATIDIPEDLYREGQSGASPEAWLDSWLLAADKARKVVSPGASTREILSAGRNCLKPE